MNNDIFYNGLEPDAFIEKKFIEINNLDDRKMTRQVMTEIFQEISRYTANEYQKLSEKIEHELSMETNHKVITGIIDRKYYDATNTEMFPMIDDDIDEISYQIKEIIENLDKNNPFYLYTVFFKADYKVIDKIIKTNNMFKCTIHTVNGERTGRVNIKLQDRYFELLENLYETYQINGEQWRTVCAPYLFKLFDVYLISADISLEDVIENIVIDFGEYNQYIEYNMLPTWNIERCRIVAEVNPIPCVDQVHYRHSINQQRLEEDSQYLVCDNDIEIYSVKCISDLEIECSTSDVRKWNLYRESTKMTRRYDYECFVNRTPESSALAAKTIAGIHGFINGLGYKNYLKLVNVKFSDRVETSDTYYTEEYLNKEIKIPKTYSTMILEFQKTKESNYLTDDVISYMVSAVQREFREYNCIGIIC